MCTIWDLVHYYWVGINCLNSLFGAIGGNIALGADAWSLFLTTSNVKVQFEWKKLIRRQRCFSFDPVSTHGLRHLYVNVLSRCLFGKNVERRCIWDDRRKDSFTSQRGNWVTYCINFCLFINPCKYYN